MRKIGLLVLSVAAVFGILSQQPSFTQFVKDTLSSIPGGPGVPHVATNAILAASSTATYPSGVWRDDFASGNGAPPLFYSGASSCPWTSGADNGACVTSLDSRIWVAKFDASGADLREWGVIADGSTDNATTLQKAFSWLAASGGRLVAPSGTISFSVAQSFTLPNSAFSVFVQGSSMGGTKFAFTGATGAAITANYQNLLNSTNWKDLTITTNQAGGTKGLLLSSSVASLSSANLATSTLENVSFYGSDGGFSSKYFDEAISVVGADQILFTNIYVAGDSAFHGIGVHLAATSAACCAVQYAFTNPILQSLSVGVKVEDYVQGVTINQGSISTTNAILVPVTALHQAELSLVNATTNTRGATVKILGCGYQTYIAFNDMYVPDGFSAVELGADCGTTVIGNTVQPSGTGGTGIGVTVTATTASTPATIISKNQFYFLATGVSLAASSARAQVSGNDYTSTTTIVSNSGSGNIIGTPSTLTIGSNQAGLSVGTTYFCALGCSTTEANAQFPSPSRAYFDRLTVYQSSAPGSGKTNTFTFRCAGSDTALTTTLAGASGFNQDTTHAATAANGDVCDLKAVIDAAAAATGSLQATVRMGLNP